MYTKLVILATDDEYDELVKGIVDGSNVLRLDPASRGHAYIVPPMEAVSQANETLDQDSVAFYRDAHRLLETEIQATKTATEAVLDRSGGLAAALTLIASSMQELESAALRLCEQAVSDSAASWTSSVSWTGDYTGASVETQEVPTVA